MLRRSSSGSCPCIPVARRSSKRPPDTGRCAPTTPTRDTGENPADSPWGRSAWQSWKVGRNSGKGRTRPIGGPQKPSRGPLSHPLPCPSGAPPPDCGPRRRRRRLGERPRGPRPPGTRGSRARPASSCALVKPAPATRACRWRGLGMHRLRAHRAHPAAGGGDRRGYHSAALSAMRGPRPGRGWGTPLARPAHGVEPQSPRTRALVHLLPTVRVLFRRQAREARCGLPWPHPGARGTCAPSSKDAIRWIGTPSSSDTGRGTQWATPRGCHPPSLPPPEGGRGLAGAPGTAPDGDEGSEFHSDF